MRLQNSPFTLGMGAIVETKNFTRHTTSLEDLYPNTLVGKLTLSRVNVNS